MTDTEQAPAPEHTAAPEYPFALIASANFRTFKRGDLIEDGAIISQILDSHHEHFVVRVAKPAR